MSRPLPAGEAQSLAPWPRVAVASRTFHLGHLRRHAHVAPWGMPAVAPLRHVGCWHPGHSPSVTQTLGLAAHLGWTPEGDPEGREVVGQPGRRRVAPLLATRSQFSLSSPQGAVEKEASEQSRLSCFPAAPVVHSLLSGPGRL